MIKKFKISGNNKYYVSAEVAKYAIGYSSLGSYIVSLQVENRSVKEDLTTKIEKLEIANDEILNTVRAIKVGADPKTIPECFSYIQVGYQEMNKIIVRDVDITAPQQAALLAELKKVHEFLVGIQRIYSLENDKN